MQPETPPQAPVGQDQQRGLYKPQPIQTPTQAAPQVGGPAASAPAAAVAWEASEYVHHEKGASWIVGFIIVDIAVLALALWTGSWTFIALIIVMIITVSVFAFRKPRTLHYSLTPNSVTIEDKSYSLDDYRTFGVLSEGAFFYAMLIPTKRFMPALSLYFSQQEGERVVDVLGSRLPMQEIKLDFIDRLMRQLRF